MPRSHLLATALAAENCSETDPTNFAEPWLSLPHALTVADGTTGSDLRPFFEDGFESGDLSAWSSSSGRADSE